MTREDFMSDVYNTLDFLPTNEEANRIIDSFDRVTSNIEQELKTGHWEWLTEDKYRCSNCNSETRVDECMNKPMYDFCPFCGARMVEPQESEN